MGGQDGFKDLIRGILHGFRDIKWVTFFNGANSREEEGEGMHIYSQALIGRGGYIGR